MFRIVYNNIDSGVDVVQALISTSAIFGIGLLWVNFSKKVFETVRRLATALLSRPSDEKEEE